MLRVPESRRVTSGLFASKRSDGNNGYFVLKRSGI
jgi:hypothetical protein